MPIAKITGQGLAAIGFSVALLWGCVLGEQAMIRKAYQERSRVMLEVERLQHRRRPIPVSTPMFPFPRRLPVTAG